MGTGTRMKSVILGFGLVASLFFAVPAAAEDMSFEIVILGNSRCGARCPEVIAAQGEIVNDTPQTFLNFVQQNARRSNRLHNILLLDSPGGKVGASMEFGHVLRRLGMAVIVARPAANSAQTGDLYSGRCYSACVYALMGGRKRVIPPQSRVGVHRMFNYSTSFDLSEGGLVKQRYFDDGGMRQTLSQYSEMMGVSSDLISLAERTSPDRIHVLSRAEIARWRLGSGKL
jgi:hypothetical protein